MTVRPLFDLGPSEGDALSVRTARSLSCISCGLFKGAISPKIPPYGDFRRKLMTIGEAPGECISGDSLIDTAFRDKGECPDGVPIRDLVGRSGFYVYSYDINSESVAVGKVRRVWLAGRNKVFRVTYEWFFATLEGKCIRLQRSIKVTENHLFLLRTARIAHDPFKGAESEFRYLSINDGLTIGHSIQPFHRTIYDRRYKVGSATGIFVEANLLARWKFGAEPSETGNAHHINENTLDDRWENLEWLSVADHARHHMSVSNPMYNPIHRATHNRAMEDPGYRDRHSLLMKEVTSDPIVRDRLLRGIMGSNAARSQTVREKFKDPVYYRRYLEGRARYFGWTDEEIDSRFLNKFPSDNHKIIAVEECGVEDVYDMDVDHYHNFAVNGIFVHNSEDKRGLPWQGKTGTLLRRTLSDLGVDLDRDCVSLNSVNCRPPDNREPTPHERSCCRVKFVDPAIAEYRPRVILLLGGVATASVLGPLSPDLNAHISKWRGWRIPVPEWGCHVCPTFHPSFVSRESLPEVDVIWRRDIRAAIDLLASPAPEPADMRKMVVILRDDDAIVRALEDARGSRLFSFDYETTGLVPSLHRLVSASFATSVDRTYSFAWTGSERVRAALASVLSDPEVGKISHNLKFEAGWSAIHLGVENIRWTLDTMLGAHVLDNRQGVCSLKLQGFLRLGVRPWETVIEPYLKSAGGPNDENRIYEFVERHGWDEELIYGGIDSLVTLRLALVQMEEFGL